MPFTPTDQDLLKKAEFFAVYPNPYRPQLVTIGKNVYRNLLRPSGAIPNLAIFELHLEAALYGSGILNQLIADILKTSQGSPLPSATDRWWDSVASAMSRFLVWNDWSDISS